jgi:hypothetical protein
LATIYGLILTLLLNDVAVCAEYESLCNKVPFWRREKAVPDLLTLSAEYTPTLRRKIVSWIPELFV